METEYVLIIYILYSICFKYVYLFELRSAGEEEKGVDSEEDVADGTEPGAPGGSPSGQTGKDSKKVIRTTRKRHRTLANKPQDFQVQYVLILLHFLSDNFWGFKQIKCYCKLDPRSSHRGSAVAWQQHKAGGQSKCVRSDPQNKSQKRKQSIL